MGNNLLQSIGDNMQFVLVCAVVIAAILAVSELMERTILKDNIGHPGKTHTITICGMLGALAGILYLFDFSVAFLAPGFYKLDFSEIPVMIGAFYLCTGRRCCHRTCQSTLKAGHQRYLHCFCRRSCQLCRGMCIRSSGRGCLSSEKDEKDRKACTAYRHRIYGGIRKHLQCRLSDPGFLFTLRYAA